MSKHSYNKVWLHLIWGTKRRDKLIPHKTQPYIAKKLISIATEKGFSIRACHVNADHVHTLIDMPTNLSIEQLAKLLKGVSSHWINSDKIIPEQFKWNKGYAVFSVSESGVKRVIRYIQNQEEHHKQKTFHEEVKEFLKASPSSP
ncbi:MAG: IS200/IS605 family transposase [Candidatus Cloacimonetes bacterium]|nr:IS200/IS605 family transposase [Candidatus Cloacimonadota bacterium]